MHYVNDVLSILLQPYTSEFCKLQYFDIIPSLDSPVFLRALWGIGKCHPADAPPFPSHPTTAGGGTLTDGM